MFKKKECPRCKRKVDEKYSFCPHCGQRFDSDEESDDWGMLGKNDFMSMDGIKIPVGLNALFNSLMRNLSKEFDEQLNKNYFPDEKNKKVKRDGISISISTFGNGPPKIKVTQLGEKPKMQVQKEVKEKLKQNTFTEEKVKKFGNLKREEPKTSIRRLSNKIMYEIEMPGVKSLDDVSITKLENSIEIKAIAKDKAYIKKIPINLPITNYDLSEGKLILELAIKN